jgi:hypothetical protein
MPADDPLYAKVYLTDRKILATPAADSFKRMTRGVRIVNVARTRAHTHTHTHMSC